MGPDIELLLIFQGLFLNYRNIKYKSSRFAKFIVSFLAGHLPPFSNYGICTYACIYVFIHITAVYAQIDLYCHRVQLSSKIRLVTKISTQWYVCMILRLSKFWRARVRFSTRITNFSRAGVRVWTWISNFSRARVRVWTRISITAEAESESGLEYQIQNSKVGLILINIVILD